MSIHRRKGGEKAHAPHLLRRGLGGLVAALAAAPLALVRRLGPRVSVLERGVLLLRRRHAVVFLRGAARRGLLELLGRDVVVMWVLNNELRVHAALFLVLLLVRLLVRGLVVGLVLREDLFDGDTLVLGLALGLDALDLLVVREVLEVLGVVVSLVRLRLRGRVELLWG